MSTKSVLDLTLDTRTRLSKYFTCICEILILSPYLTKLPNDFLQKNIYVKSLDMSKCTKITVIPDDFCRDTIIENIILPPNIESIGRCFVFGSKQVKKLNISHCNKLTSIGDYFCSHVSDIIFPISIQHIYSFCFRGSKNLTFLDLSYCVNLTYIGHGFCKYVKIQYIKFPESLQSICAGICYKSENVKKLDFSKCKVVKINTSNMCKVESLKLYSIDNIDMQINGTYNKIECKNLYISNITKTKTIDLTFIMGLENVYLPKGEYCIIDNDSNVKFWLGNEYFSADYFTELKYYTYQSLPVHGIGKTLYIKINIFNIFRSSCPPTKSFRTPTAIHRTCFE
jgi:hypothetical protein